MAFSPLGAAISALSVIPTEITLLRTWELSGLMLPGAPSEIMFTGIMLAAGNVMLGLIYVYHNEINPLVPYKEQTEKMFALPAFLSQSPQQVSQSYCHQCGFIQFFLCCTNSTNTAVAKVRTV